MNHFQIKPSIFIVLKKKKNLDKEWRLGEVYSVR